MPFVDPGDFTPLQIVSETNMDNIRNDLIYLNDNLPFIGAMFATPVPSAPTGWLYCDGTAVSRATYAALFAAIGISSGPGDGATTFNLPDMRFKFPMGKAAAGTGSTLGGVGGSANAITVSHNHTQDVHGHSGNSHNHTQDAHGHTVSDPGHEHAADGDFGNRYMVTVGSSTHKLSTTGNDLNLDVTDIDANTTGVSVNANTATNQAATQSVNNTTATNQATGSSATDANLPPWVALNWFIKY